MKKEIEITKLQNAYNKGSKELKSELIELYGMETFQQPSPDIRKRFEDACKVQKLDPKKILHTDDELCIEQQVSNAYTMLRVLAKAKRGSWEPDYANRNEEKWYSWFEFKKGVGFVFDDAGYDYPVTDAHVGSRLCFPNSEDAKSFTLENLELYKIILEN